MITFVRTPDCAFCDRVEEILDNLVVAHETELVVADAATDPAPPFLREGDATYATEAEIQGFLRTLARELAVARQVTGSCYIDPVTGATCEI